VNRRTILAAGEGKRSAVAFILGKEKEKKAQPGERKEGIPPPYRGKRGEALLGNELRLHGKSPCPGERETCLKPLLSGKRGRKTARPKGKRNGSSRCTLAEEDRRTAVQRERRRHM